MESIEILNTHGTLQNYHVKKTMTLREFIKEVRLQDKFFIILVNGIRIKMTDSITEKDEIVVLPRIAGG